MTFYSIPFMVMFLLTIIGIRFIKQVRIQNVLLLFVNIMFYAFWDLRFFLLILFEIFIVYYYALKISVSKKRKYVVIPTVLFVGVLCYFKYLDFFVTSFCNIFSMNNNLVINIILPLGISFYTFQALSYVYDVYYGKLLAEKDIIKIAVYISFFPQIISGPIVKAKDFLKQLDYAHKITKQNITDGLQIFLIGFIKKKVFADRIAICVDAVYAAPVAYHGVSVMLAVIAYAVQIYCDFSGYSDMAIGIAKMIGFDLGKNFDAPYLAKNPSEFWRRWHISLSTWFRDYLYIPLGGSHRGRSRTYLNLFITMVISGLWHGANWTFILWGVFHGIGSVLHKVVNDIMKTKGIMIKDIKLTKCISIILNNIFVVLLWVIFRADSMEHALCIIRSIFNPTGIIYISPYVIVYTSIVIAAHIFCVVKNNGIGQYMILDVEKFYSKVIISILIFGALALMYVGNSAFIYAQF